MVLGSLEFRGRRGNALAEHHDQGTVLRGEVEWLVSGAASDIGELCRAVGPFADAVSPDRALLRFGNSVGTFEVAGLGRLSVRCGKWSEATFDSLLAEITAKVGGLPFAVDQFAGLAHDRSIVNEESVLLQAFLYARLILLSEQSMVPALESIVRDPHRLFVAERRRVHLHECSQADARTLRRLSTGAEVIVRASGFGADLPLAMTLGGHLPVSIEEPHVRHSVDTAENRFAKGVLDQLDAIINRVDGEAVRFPRAAFWVRAVSDCEAMRRVLGRYRRNALWADVGRMTHLPIGSIVLQRRRGYRQLLRHHLMLRAAARLPLDDERMRRLIGLKDVASLYELWVYFAVVDAVGDVLGRRPDDAGRPVTTSAQVDLPWGLRATWTEGISVYYNLTFSRAAGAPHRSTSVRLRPDVVIHDARGGRDEMHVLDAKLRIDRHGTDGAVGNDEVDVVSFKNDDVAKMHAYRDALPRVRSAYVLYPGTEHEHFPSVHATADTVDGVGAIGLVPGEDAGGLRAHVARILGLEA